MTELCAALSELGVWTRLHYVYPYPHVDEVIPLMAEGKILPYLDIPFQHASPRILKRHEAARVRRQDLGAHQALARDLSGPDAALHLHRRLSGETEEDVQYLLDWMSEAQLDRVGCFQYSPVEGAPANALDNPVPDEVKQERWERFMAHQQGIIRRSPCRRRWDARSRC